MTAIEVPTSIPATSTSPHLFRRLLRRPLSLISLIFLAIVVLIAFIGPLIAPYDPNLASLQLILAPPSPEHLLGADSAGRDVLSRLLVATQVSVAAAVLAVVVSLVFGVTSGLLAGYYQGWFDNVASWFTSLVMALPGMVVLLAARAVLGPSVWISMVIFGIILAPAYFRLVYTSVTAVRSELFVDAARVSGLSDARIIGRHVLSVVRAPIIIQTAIVAGIAIAIQSGLEFLGLGDTSVPTWGSMLNDAFANIYKQPLLMLWPSLAIGLTSVALTLLANGMRDVLERTIVVRRKRRRAVTTLTGSVAAVTTATSVTDLDDSFDIVLADGGTAEGDPIRHADDEQSALRSREVVLSIKDLRVGYGQSDGSTTEVVHGVSLEIRKGEVHGLIGESGSGKSQTAFAVLGLLPKGGSVTGGTIEYEGTQLQNGSDAVYSGIRGRRIAYIPQEPMSNLDASFTIGSQLVEPLRVTLGMTKKEATDKALSLLERVGIPQPLRTFKAYPFEVSGGMAQRVLIAGAVSTDPDLIIADEPTTALDVTVQAEVLDLLRDLQAERQMAMLLVTHNFGVVADLCDRVTVMQSGLFVETGPVRAIFNHPEHPYTKSLLDAILDEGPARPALAASASKGVRS
ncbi:dipeptide/oligopeptide/nickel ABC transporter permease/ATP-binding protein [Microbacterium rhizomatis]|uniref:Dipeptide/oligopeptide/nickel ABC transporter permease/ATP-binding protein n=1 Tax=Microbacterium rhizomatis TaxID=1631477 RepID=A0A5J5IZE1_9MICO|nr:dipeptide/oligopeptide/nickel ABC transporter permease/ATP-binding protein [Microbacterium rhizomatis]KAA9107696.1 dipeptide/oligopeptide/nickel ABC transporter permease/ATP-binding protein [Microbacterium rhizomatis]